MRKVVSTTDCFSSLFNYLKYKLKNTRAHVRFRSSTYTKFKVSRLTFQKNHSKNITVEIFRSIPLIKNSIFLKILS